MSLPAGQQEILDGIAETLKASEPRLASMFAIFGRLFTNDGPPLRERLPTAGPVARLAGLRRRVPGGRRKYAWQLGFVLANVVVALVVSLVLALNTHSGRICVTRPTAAAFVTGGQYCRTSAGSSGTRQQR
jgi:hypothetical protein